MTAVCLLTESGAVLHHGLCLPYMPLLIYELENLVKNNLKKTTKQTNQPKKLTKKTQTKQSKTKPHQTKKTPKQTNKKNSQETPKPQKIDLQY